ncbi:MAG: membrane protein [Caldimonas sp.]|nr:MAG: membrane protein [Caldimonas sp.]
MITIDWTHFTPGLSLAGGLLLGVAAALFILLNGRVLGISGIVAGLLRPRRGDAGWRLAFVLGLLAAPAVYAVLAPLPQARIDADWGVLVIAGLLVGLGTRYGAGCTSGHGVCGLSRLSPRSLVATLAFMGAGFLTVYLVRHGFA